MGKKIILGICCINEKLQSQPMKCFIQKLKNYKDLEIVEFDNEIIFQRDIEEWPKCDFFLSFFSNGFPLEKAIKYVELRNPIQINDLKSQLYLKDRRKVYQLLESVNIPLPKHIYVHRHKKHQKSPVDQNEIDNCTFKPESCGCDTGGSASSSYALLNNHQDTPVKTIKEFEEFNEVGEEEEEEETIIEKEDYIEISGKRIYKPFLEKPFNAEDHNIYIYYSRAQGGGCRKLHRKIGNNSSTFDPSLNNIRIDGCYIYEEFIQIDDSKDVKVYSTPTFSIAELRKSPSVDGKVERGCTGREKRIETPLTTQENEISSKINSLFNQFVCGYDILRANGKSLICDVNGWTMVKGEHKEGFYENASKSLYNFIVSKITNPHNSNNSFSKNSISTMEFLSPDYNVNNRKLSSPPLNNNSANTLPKILPSQQNYFQLV